MKKVILIVTGIIGLLFLIAIVAPFVVDLNKFKPQIQTLVENNINGSIDFENIELTIFSGLGAELQKVKIISGDNFSKKTFFEVEKIKIKVPFFSIFSGLKKASFYVFGPRLHLIKNKEGKLNLSDLLSKSVELESEIENKEVEEKGNLTQIKKQVEKSQKVQAPASKDNFASTDDSIIKLIKKVAIDFDFLNASLNYFDESKESIKKIEKLNLKMKNIRLGKEFSFEFNSSVSLNEEGMLSEGDLVATGTIFADLKDRKPELQIKGSFDLQDFVLKMPGILEKTDSDELLNDFYISYSDFKLKFTNSLKLKLTKLMGRTFDDTIELKIRVNSILDAEYLPQYTDLALRFASKGSDIKLRGRISNLDNAEVDINSSYFKLDDFVEPPPVLLQALLAGEKKPEEGTQVENKSEEQAAPTQVAEQDGAKENIVEEEPDPFQGLRNNSYFLGLKITSDINFTRVIVARTEFKNILATFTLNKLKLFASCTMNVFKGNINVGQLVFNMRRPRPLFALDANILSIDINPAFESLVGIKDSAEGKFSGSMSFTGGGLDPKIIKQTIKGQAKFKGKNVNLKFINIMEEVKKTLNKSALDKLNLTKYSFDEGLDRMTFVMNIGNGVAAFQPLEMFKKEVFLLQLKGNSTFEPVLDFAGDLKIIQPLSTKLARGRSTKTLFLNRRKEIVLPYYIKGPMSELSYGVDTEKLTSRLGKRVKDKVKAAAKDKLGKEAKKLLKNKGLDDKVINKIPQKHQDKAKKLFKKFGF